MMGNIARIVAQFKQSWSQELEEQAIEQACREAGHKWRDRELGPVATVRMFLLQILFGNVSCEFVPHLAGKKVTGSAYCAARGRLPLAGLQTLLSRSTAKMAECVRDTGLWLGHRLYLLDGSSFSMPDTDELREHFGQPGGQAEGCGFPTAHWLALLHFGSGLFQKVLTAALRTHDLNGVAELHPELAAGDGKPKVIQNPESDWTIGPQRFEPLISEEWLHQLIAKLKKRGETQRGKPRSKDPAKNPLGTRFITWPAAGQCTGSLIRTKDSRAFGIAAAATCHRTASSARIAMWKARLLQRSAGALSLKSICLRHSVPTLTLALDHKLLRRVAQRRRMTKFRVSS
jgi:hypothetical protein